MAKAAIDQATNKERKSTKAGRARIQQPPTKQDQLIRMLRTSKGVGVEVIGKKMDWQLHTVRAAQSRLRQAGFEIRKEVPPKGKTTCYRIVSQPNRPVRQMSFKFGETANAQINLTASTTADLRRRIESLEQTNNVALPTIWKQAWGQAAPNGARTRFLMLRIAWKCQSELLGGLSPELARRLTAQEARSRPQLQLALPPRAKSKRLPDLHPTAAPTDGHPAPAARQSAATLERTVRPPEHLFSESSAKVMLTRN